MRVEREEQVMDAPQAERSRYGSVVVGFDGSTESVDALELATSIATIANRTLIAVFVRHLPAFIEASSAFGAAETALDDLADRLSVELKASLAGRDDIQWSFEVREGDPASTLIDAANEHGASVIVVGHRGHNRAASLLLGSVATKLVHHAPQSVLVARPESVDPVGE
jgi:nucleotide-binding universal stress UspA family protein